MLRIGYFSSLLEDTTRRPTYTTWPPLTPGWYGVHDRVDAKRAYEEGLKKLRAGISLKMPTDYLPGMGRRAGLPSDQVEREIAEATRTGQKIN